MMSPHGRTPRASASSTRGQITAAVKSDTKIETSPATIESSVKHDVLVAPHFGNPAPHTMANRGQHGFRTPHRLGFLFLCCAALTAFVGGMIDINSPAAPSLLLLPSSSTSSLVPFPPSIFASAAIS